MQPSMVMVSARGRSTPTPFASVIAHRQMGYGLASPTMGQTTPFQWYQKAKAETAKFAGLLERTAKVANRTAREEILGWLGKSDVRGTPAYVYASVMSDIAENVEAYSPPNYDAYQVSRRRERVAELDSVNKDFERKVNQATATYGELPEPVKIERIITVPGAPGAPGELPAWAMPVAIGAGAVAVAGLLALLNK
jgi:hypothetical protein